MLMALAVPAAGANGQELAYQDVLRAEHAVGPRLGYQPMDTGSAPAAPAPRRPRRG